MITPVRPSDYRLLHRFAFDDDEGAFEELVRRHAEMARGVCRRVLGPAGDADDAAQAAFLSLAQHARPLAVRLGPSGSLAGWLYRVAVNAALQQRRASKARRRREVAVIREREQTSDGVTCAVEQAELLAVLDEELKSLPQRYRTPLVLCHLEGKTQHEAAEELGLSYGTFRRRLDRGRKLLRARIKRRGVLATSVGILCVLQKSVAEAAGSSADLIASISAAVKDVPPPVSVVRPRVASSGRVPGPTVRRPGSIPVSVYVVLLATLLVAMAVPPVVSRIASAGNSAPSADADRPAAPSSALPSTSHHRSAV